MARRNGRSYVVKGETPKRYWEPSRGDVVYIEGTKTKLGKPYADPDTGKLMFPLRPSVRGTTDMSAGNIKAIARVEEGKGLESVGSTATFSRRPNPSGKFRVMASFGAKVLSSHSSLKPALRSAKKHSRRYPVDVWNGNIRVAHFNEGEGTHVATNPGPSAIPTRGQTYTIATKKGPVQAKFVGETFIYYFFQPVSGGREIVMRKSTAGKRIENPAHGPSALPTKWTPATVSRKGRQIQIRVGGGR